MILYLDISNTYVVEVRDLRALLAVVRCGSFTEAAHQLGYTQSAVSQQVAALEAEVGRLLVERRPVRPTPAGTRLAEHASHVLLRLDVARSELGRGSRAPEEIHVAAGPLAAPGLLARCIRQVRATRPDVRVVLSSPGAAAAVEAVASGAVEAAMVDGIAGPNEPLRYADTGLLSSAGLAESKLAVVLPTGHPLNANPQVSLETLADAPWVLAPALADPGPLLRHSGPRHRPLVYEGTDLLTLLELVAAGLGVALLPLWCPAQHPGVVGVPLGQPSLFHRTELLTLRAPPGTANPLVDALRRPLSGGAPAPA
jgi:DNA-binding transcriptional LysR family regulator